MSLVVVVDCWRLGREGRQVGGEGGEGGGEAKAFATLGLLSYGGIGCLGDVLGVGEDGGSGLEACISLLLDGGLIADALIASEDARWNL